MSGADEGLRLLRSASLDWVHRLVERLEQAEIPCHVTAVGEKCARNGTWAVYVRPGDAPRALEVDAAVLREVVPDVPDDFDPEATDSGRCPACAEPVLDRETECPSCGLALL